MKERADLKRLMLDISDVYLKSLKEIADYWEESKEKKTITNGRERIIAAEPEEKRIDTIHEMENVAFSKIQKLKADWEESENEYFTLAGENVTDDVKLLNEVFNPSLEQLKALAEKYFGKNWTMEQAIRNFADGKKKYASILDMPHTQSKEERLHILELYDSKQLRNMYKDTAERGGLPSSLMIFKMPGKSSLTSLWVILPNGLFLSPWACSGCF